MTILTRPVRVYLSTPDDLIPERDLLTNVIEEFNHTTDVIRLIPYTFEEGKQVYHSTSTHLELSQPVMRPEASDIYISMVWMTLGRRAPTQTNPETGKPYQSYLEYEFMSAYRMFRNRAAPRVILYRCIRPVPDMRKLDVLQFGRVQRFFDRFGADTALGGWFSEFETPQDLDFLIRRDLRDLIDQLPFYPEEPSEQVVYHIPVALPDPYVRRENALSDLRMALCGNFRAVGIVSEGETALGQGKTTLARAICDDPVIRCAHPDGILWATLGTDPDYVRIQRDWIRALHGDTAAVQNEASGRAELKRLMQQRVMLLVFDDVRSAMDIIPLDVGPYCQVLITARDKNQVREALLVNVEGLRNQEGIELVSRLTSNKALSTTVEEIVRRAGRMPFILKLIGGMLNSGTSWHDILSGWDINKPLFRGHPHGEILALIKTVVDHLPANESSRYHELAIFNPNDALSVEVISKLWQRTAGRDAKATQELLTKLRSRSLLGDSMHELHYEYLNWAMKGLLALHGALADAYVQESPSGLPTDDYSWRNLVRHLAWAGRTTDANKLLTDYSYLQIKIARFGTDSVIRDFATLPIDDPLQPLAGALALAAPILDHEPRELTNQLFGRLGAAPKLHNIIEYSGPHFLLESRTLTPPNWPLLHTFKKHTFWVNSCAFSPDGKQILSGSSDKTLRLWDIATRRNTLTLRGHSGPVNDAVFSHNGEHILSASADMSLMLWNTASGKMLRTFTGHTDTVNGCVLNRAGDRALSASADGTVRVWDIYRAQPIQTLTGHTGAVHACALDDEGVLALSASDDGTLRVWNTDRGEELFQFGGHKGAVLDCAFSGDGKLALSASSDKTLRTWDVRFGESLLTLEGHTHWVLGCALSQDGRFALSASLDNTLRLWDVQNGQQLHVYNSAGGLTDCAFDPNMEYVLSASSDKNLQLWDADLTKLTDQGNIKNGEGSCNYSPQGTLAVSVGAHHVLHVWEGLTSLHLLRGHTDTITVCHFNPDGTLILSGSIDGTLRLWNARNGELVCKFNGHEGGVTDACFDPSGNLILSAGMDKALRLWSITNSKEIMRWTADMPLLSCAFSPAQNSVITHDSQGNLHFLKMVNL
jgi:WD40 repeat protein